MVKVSLIKSVSGEHVSFYCSVSLNDNAELTLHVQSQAAVKAREMPFCLSFARLLKARFVNVACCVCLMHMYNVSDSVRYISNIVCVLTCAGISNAPLSNYNLVTCTISDRHMMVTL